ncbi:MAG: ATP-binding cassette domain-containing protein [Candidatus Hydrogenedentales bacterium]|jgi:ABC-2 type transport system ATP-binding protein
MNADAGPAVVVRGLGRRFGAFRAVNNVTFDVPQGQIFGFLGPNGAGKSTTIRMLCGILAPTEGEGRVAGCDLRTQAEEIKARIGYMSQKFSLYEDLTVEENIDFYSGIYRIPAKKKQERKTWALEMAGLSAYRGMRTGLLSGGWKQRLSLGCALLHEPPVLFLDEPTSGVDPISRREFWDLIYELSGRGVTVFVTTHYMDEAEYCDRIGMIYRGELVAMGTPEALKRETMADDVLEVLCERPSEAMEFLERMEVVQEAALFGNGLHVTATRASNGGAAVRRALVGAGFSVRRVEVITPSMEDVFVSLVEARDRLAAAQGEVAV